MKKSYRLLTMILTFSILLPLFTTLVCAGAVESTLFSEDFERFSEHAGIYLTQENGFSNQIPSTTQVVKDENNNTFVKIDFKSGEANAEETVWYVRENGSYKLVDESYPNAIKTDRGSYGLISGVDVNLDKNLQVRNSEYSYESDPNLPIVFEVCYYLSEDAKGTIQAQVQQYKANPLLSTETEAKKGSWLALWRINSESGQLTAKNGNSTQNIYLSKGEWQTVSMVVDLLAGKADLYLNHALAISNITMDEDGLVVLNNSFIAAKIPRTTSASSNAKNDLSGYFGVDDVRMYTPNQIHTTAVAKKDSLGQELVYVELLKNGVVEDLNYNSTVFLLSNGYTVKPVYFDESNFRRVITTESEASIRLYDSGGIRFVNKLNLGIYQNLLDMKERGELQDVSFGTLIAPARYVRDAQGHFTVEALSALRNNFEYLMVEGNDGHWYGGEAYTFAGSIENIRPSHYGEMFQAVGYVSVTLNNGTVKYFYGAPNARGVSIETLATEALSSERAQAYTEAQRAYLESVLPSPVDVGTSSLISNVLLASDHLFFGMENASVSLVYSGNYGWRIRARAAGVIKPESFGAAQALAFYMGEESVDQVLPITLENDTANSKLYLRAADGTYACVQYGTKFAIHFYSPKGELVSTVREIRVDTKTGKTIIRGDLVKDEAVFGGGERFDTVNRLNAGVLDLYTCDGWNRSDTSYMAIPLFSTARGAGIFVNRYEAMTAEFVSADTSYWEIVLNKELMDCYIFASGDIKDVIKGYTALTGSADAPEEWAQGVMLCRYGPDLWSYETDKAEGTLNRDDAPAGRSVKTLVSNMIAAGMKPSSVVMENWDYNAITHNSAKYNELKATADWLDSLGIKTMVYMRVGESRMTTMKGFKNEYLLHATVTTKSGSSYTTQIPDVKYATDNPDVKNEQHQYIDITNEEAMNWFMDSFWRVMLEVGVDGIKIDFCETMPDEYFNYNGTSVEYDWKDPSKIISGTEHHAYPTYFISAFYKRMNELKEQMGLDDGFVVLSRGGGIGSQRNPYIWAGDQVRSFLKLDDQIMAVVNSGLSGVPFMTYDMAGYRYRVFTEKVDGVNVTDGCKYSDADSLEYESEVFARAVAFSAFMPNIQTHGTVRNAYEMTAQTQGIYRNFTKLHEELMPYINQYIAEAASTGLPIVRQPVLHYQSDNNVWSLKDQFLLGDGLMVAPIIKEGTTTRTVYLPAGNTWTNLLTGEVLEGGTSYTVEASLWQIPVFLNNSSAHADELRTIFEGNTWQAIQNETAIPMPE